ncbi:MAG: hypothetical protein R3B84_18800 [Zavarzinella sp.]
MMHVEGPKGQLADAWKTFQAHWDLTSETWNDTVHQDFQENFWEPLKQLVANEIRAMEQLSTILRQCRQECSDESGVWGG